MKDFYLTSVSSAITKFPKKLLLWNYWDHEHIVGTHFEHYKKVNILYEDSKVCFSERWAKLPFIPFYLKTTDFAVLTNSKQMDVHHYALLNLVYCKQTFKFRELDDHSCKVTRYDYLKAPKLFSFLQPLFEKIMKKWFIKVWEEDMPMRERRLKVWELGFVDFKGIDYVNNKNLKKRMLSKRKYKLDLPIPKITHEKNKTKEKVFLRKVSKSKNLGYGLPDM
tara:strand:+ start:269 stop:934 length:666 start_codon:yes stop_codon:yes gene_type:complete